MGIGSKSGIRNQNEHTSFSKGGVGRGGLGWGDSYQLLGESIAGNGCERVPLSYDQPTIYRATCTDPDSQPAKSAEAGRGKVNCLLSDGDHQSLPVPIQRV